MSLPVTFEQNVKERIKAIVGELVPEEVWEKVVRETIVSFLRDDLPKLIKAELTEKYKTLILTELAKPEWAAQWNNVGKQTGSKMVEEIIKKTAPDILATMIGGITQQMISNLQSQVQQYR